MLFYMPAVKYSSQISSILLIFRWNHLERLHGHGALKNVRLYLIGLPCI